MTAAAVFSDPVAALSFGASVDARLGYPRAGSDFGAGVHARPEDSVTLRYEDVAKHPTLALWAYPLDAAVQGSAVPIPGTATTQTLDATWTPPTAIGAVSVSVSSTDAGAATP